MSSRTNYELQIWWSLDGQAILNVFHYHQFHSFPTLHYAQKLFFAIQVNVTPLLLDCVSSDIATTHMYSFDLDDEIGDHYTDSFVHAGTRPAGHFPKFMAWRFKKYKSSRKIYNGWFRFAGISSTDLLGSTPTPFIIGRLNAFATVTQHALAEFGFLGNLSIYSKSTPTNPVRTMYPTRDLKFDGVTTQNTRKR